MCGPSSSSDSEQVTDHDPSDRIQALLEGSNITEVQTGPTMINLPPIPEGQTKMELEIIYNDPVTGTKVSIVE